MHKKRSLTFETLEPRVVLSTAPLITEFMAVNDSTLADGDGNSSDWIEIHNPTGSAIDLAGWHLTDNAANLDKWTFSAAPQSVIPAGEYLVVFASGQETETYIDGGGNLHTDFALSGSGEYLALVDPAMTVVHEYAPTFPEQAADISYGLRETGGVYDLGQQTYFSDPSPGEDNGLGAGTVEFSRSGGTFSTNFSLALATDHPTASIRYTTNGAIPTASSTLYTGPLFVASSTRIRAAAFVGSIAQGPTQSESFIKIGSTLTNFRGTGQAFESNLPLIVFDSFGNGAVDFESDDFVPASAVFIDPGEDGVTVITDPAQYAGRTGMHIRGRSSQGWAKKQYALEIWGEGHSDTGILPGSATDDLDVSLFGLPAESDWVLNGPFSDKTQLNNYLTFQWGTEMGLEAPRTKLVEVFVNANGGDVHYGADYRGTYVLLEKIKVGDNRVDIAKLEPTDLSEPEITGGYIWKKDKTESSQGDVWWTSSAGVDYRSVEPDEHDATPWGVAQRNWLIDHINEFESVLYGPNFQDPEIGYAKYIDVDSWVNMWIVAEMTKNVDGFRLSTYFYKDRGGKIVQGPLWDYNLSLSNASFALQASYPEGWLHDGYSNDGNILNDSGNYPYWRRLFQDPDFVQRIIDRWQELRETVLHPAKMNVDIDAAVALVTNGNPNPGAGVHTDPVSRNFSRWTGVNGYGADTYQWPNAFFYNSDGTKIGSFPDNSPVGTGSPEVYSDYIDIMKWFVGERFDWIDEQYVESPLIVVAGDVATLSAPAGDIYYTLDGTDPRAKTNASTNEETLLAAGSQVAVHVPSNGSLGTRWTAVGFNDASWLHGAGGVGYETTSTNYGPYFNLDVEAEMFGNPLTPAAYVRAPFTINGSLPDYDYLTLQIQYDDGFVAYLNGTEVARSDNLPPTVAWNDRTTNDHPDNQAEQFLSFDLSAHLGLLQAGQNVLAIHGVNNGSGSSDFLISPRIVAGMGATGSFSPNAILYTGPFQVTENALITARAYDPSHLVAESSVFSGHSKQAVVISRPNIVVSEINYHPHDANPVPGLGELDLEDNQFEFIELVNLSSTTTAQLIGVQLTGELEYQFTGDSAITELAPNGRLVLVRNQAAFESRYGTGLPIAGEFANSSGLSSTEEIHLVDGTGSTIQRFTYSDGGDWPGRADGKGSSLVVIDLGGDFDDPENWRSSTAFGGTPGAAPLPNTPDVVVNEVLAHTDAPVLDTIELLNVSGAAVDIGNWWLSDSNNIYFKYQIAAGSTLASGAYLTFNESQFNVGANSFGLSAGGDDVWLIEVDGSGRPIRFADRVEFDATLSGVSLGRIPNGNGELFPLTATSLGSANGAHRPGAIVISELHYHPAPPPGGSTITEKQLEFVELTNRSGGSILLTDWRLRGGVDFDFPAGTTLANGGRLALVSFDPSNATLAAEFRATYGISDSVNLLGPWTDGSLGNGGGSVRLLAPTEPPAGDPGPVHYLVDRVIYDDAAPWPTGADGTGQSLHRSSTENYGDLGASWNAAIPSPGGAQAAGTPGDFDGDSDVDGSDLLAWQRGFGITSGAAVSGGDANGDGAVGAADLSYWQANYGASAVVGTVAALVDADDSIDAVALATITTSSSRSPENSQFNEVSQTKALEQASMVIWWLHAPVPADAARGPSPEAPQASSPEVVERSTRDRAIEDVFLSQVSRRRIAADSLTWLDEAESASFATAVADDPWRIDDIGVPL